MATAAVFRAETSTADRLQRIGFGALLGFVAALQFSIAIAQILLSVALLMWLLRLATQREQFEAPDFFVPLVAYGLVSILSLQRGTRASIVNGNQNVAVRAAEEIRRYVVTNAELLKALAADLQDTGLSLRQQDQILKNYVLQFREFREITLFDEHGVMIATSRTGSLTTSSTCAIRPSTFTSVTTPLKRLRALRCAPFASPRSRSIRFCQLRTLTLSRSKIPASSAEIDALPWRMSRPV